MAKTIERKVSDDIYVLVYIDKYVDIVVQKEIDGEGYIVETPPELQSMVEAAYMLTLEAESVVKAIDKFYQQQ